MKIDLLNLIYNHNSKQKMIKQITAKETYSVRHPVLRESKPIKSCEFDGDLLKSTIHLGLFSNNKLIGVTSLLISKNPIFNEEKQCQLRGMGILKEFQRKGYGNLILEHAERILKKKSITVLWCNAREIATKFYSKNGFQITGKPFNIPTAGRHYVMYKKL